MKKPTRPFSLNRNSPKKTFQPKGKFYDPPSEGFASTQSDKPREDKKPHRDNQPPRHFIQAPNNKSETSNIPRNKPISTFDGRPDRRTIPKLKTSNFIETRPRRDSVPNSLRNAEPQRQPHQPSHNDSIYSKKPRPFAHQRPPDFRIDNGRIVERRSKSPKYEPNKPHDSLPKVLRLNRFIAAAGVCARREADKLIEEGKVKVNGVRVTALGTKVNTEKDRVEVNGKVVKPVKFLYLVLNKPKNTLTTFEDPEGRPTVMDYVASATKERIYPVGRLDRNTTGILLFTNDGALAEKLTHPSHKIPKEYHVRLDKPLSDIDARKLKTGVVLEDGPASFDALAFFLPNVRDEVHVQIHSGRNRIVRRMFEALGYNVLYLDRIALGPLTKKGVARGKWRWLTQQEINFLKML